jgi:hypothetical protein
MQQELQQGPLYLHRGQPERGRELIGMPGHARQPSEDSARFRIQIVVTDEMFSIERLLSPGLTGCFRTAPFSVRWALAVPLADPARRYG